MEAVVSSLSGIMIRPGVCSSRRKAGEKPVANQSQVGRMPGFLGGGSSPRRRVPGFLRSKMGARPSRRRLPADSPMALDALPPELLVQVLSHVPPRALITRCRPVCRAWRDVVDGPTVWLLQLARDRSAEGRALYAVAQRCPPNSEDEEEFPLCALARYCLRAPLGRNLIFNSCGEQGFRGWEVEHGGNGWAVEKNITLVPGAPSQTCFVTSFEWCFKRQLVDLVMEGVWQELLDSAQIEICVADWWGARENCGCIYRLRVRLLDVYENEVVKFSASPNPVLQWTERGCRQCHFPREETEARAGNISKVMEQGRSGGRI
ncbi:F-box only protein 17 isoform X2 [Sus scrofa]|nr:F-box only protein 17 isoform X2 [Sus scrofa]